MSKKRTAITIFAIGLWAGVSAPGQAAPGAAVESPQFGTQDQTITVISGLDFYGEGFVIGTTFSLAFLSCASGCSPGAAQAHSTISLPAGAVIDSIGVNTKMTGTVPMNFSVYSRDHLGVTTDLGSFTIPPHQDFATDYFDLPDILIPGNSGRALVIVVRSPYLESSVSNRRLGYVEVRWRRTVSSQPATPTFGDVPTTHPFYQFIEALASSGVTGGCGGGNYCPEGTLTRGQMAVFLSKALGLHWPR